LAVKILIRFIIVDDYLAVRVGLRVALEEYDDLLLLGEGTNGKEAIALCEKLQPDVVVMDTLMPEMDGITATKVIRELFPHIQVIILTGVIDPHYAQVALEAGAVNVLEKDGDFESLVKAIRATT
jgi:two-component system, NarL family, response regulator LiaR